MIRYLLGYSAFVCTDAVRALGLAPNSIILIGECVKETRLQRRTRWQNLNCTILPLLDRFGIYYHLEFDVFWMKNCAEEFRPTHYNPAFKLQERVVEKVSVVVYSENDAFLIRMHNGTLPDPT